MSQQIDRTLDIVELMVDLPEGMALGEIATRLSLPKSAAHRLVSQLVQRGYMEQDAASQHYKLSMRLMILGFRHLSNTGLADACQPELDDLAERTGELARIAMVEEESLTWVAQAQGSRYGLRYDGNLGRRVTLPATATGKAWLATFSDEEALRIVVRNGWGDPMETGPKAIREIEPLLAAIEATRKRGYGIAYEEGEPGMAAVAAAIPGSKPGEPAVGTVSIAGPTVRLNRKSLHEIAPSILTSARRLSELWPVRRFSPTARVPADGPAMRATA
jgi:DNA-binding IclR family transcriptional regulator